MPTIPALGIWRQKDWASKAILEAYTYEIMVLVSFMLLWQNVMTKATSRRKLLFGYNFQSWSIIEGKLRPQELDTVIHITSIIKNREKWYSICLISASFLYSYTVQGPRPRDRSTALKLTLPIPIKTMNTISNMLTSHSVLDNPSLRSPPQISKVVSIYVNIWILNVTDTILLMI